MILARLRRVGLGTRIALTILVAVLLIQAVNVAAFVLLPRPSERIYSAQWLADRTAEAAEILKLPEAGRAPAAAAMSETYNLVVTSHLKSEGHDEPGSYPGPDGIEPVSLQHLRALIALKLKATSGISVTVERHPPHPPFGFAPRGPPPPRPSNIVVPETFRPEPIDTETVAAGPDRPIWGRFRITLEDAEEDRIAISTDPRPAISWLLGPPVMTGILAIVLVALLSAWTAKRSLAPLEHLADAARRMGRERVPSPVETEKLGDFAVVGEALNDMQRQLRTFIDDRTQMLGAISHDMRTGLTRLRLNAEEVPDGTGKTALIAAIEDMEQMITATLTFAGDDLAAEPSTQVDVAAIVITCCDTLQDMGADISYDGADHAAAICQPTAIKRSVMNVAENAIKYGRSAAVTLVAEDHRIVIAVRDKGPGIPEHLIPEALRPFRRIETSRSRETGGAGLGLAIARDVMSAHGGALRLENHPEGGLVATLELPRARLTQAW